MFYYKASMNILRPALFQGPFVAHNSNLDTFPLKMQLLEWNERMTINNLVPFQAVKNRPNGVSLRNTLNLSVFPNLFGVCSSPVNRSEKVWRKEGRSSAFHHIEHKKKTFSRQGR